MSRRFCIGARSGAGCDPKIHEDWCQNTPIFRQLAFHFRTTAGEGSGSTNQQINNRVDCFTTLQMHSENQVSKFELNAAIERLIESSGNDADAREILISFAMTMQSDRSASVDISAQSSGGSFSGATPQNGTVKIELDSGDKREWSFGENSKRVGYYKLSRITTKPLFREVKEERILITHFWKADAGAKSDSEEAEAWCLACNSKMEPLWFGQVGSLELFHLGPFSVIFREARETWGRNLGTAHPHALHIKARANL
jgi:hypothetical protein